ncbi:MAG: hypothetical protein ACI8RZ_004163 [Myxococcota bacterium]|jgi:hypothetical protein
MVLLTLALGSSVGSSVARAADSCTDLRLQPRAAVLTGYVCSELSEGLSLCTACGSRPVRVTEPAEWGMDVASLSGFVSASAQAALSAERPIRQEIADMPGAAYWVSQVGDGYDAAGLLHPERLSEIAGTTPVIGVPAVGTFLMWIPGDAETDKVMAVGVRRIFESAEYPVSDKIYRWHNGAWRVWGEATPSGG